MSKVQYTGGLAENYSSDSRISHPQNFLPYATWLEELGDVQGLEVLDLACGSGFSSRLLAERGARVVGVDISSDMIEYARAEEKKNPLGITYTVGDAATLDLGRVFDVVTPSFLFNYADTRETLEAFAASVARHLKGGRKMVALSASPTPFVPKLPNASHFTYWLDEPEKEGSRVNLRVFDGDGNDVCDIVFQHWSWQTYAKALFTAGLTCITWVPLKMTDEGKRAFPNWRELEQHNASIVLTAIKV